MYIYMIIVYYEYKHFPSLRFRFSVLLDFVFLTHGLRRGLQKSEGASGVCERLSFNGRSSPGRLHAIRGAENTSPSPLPPYVSKRRGEPILLPIYTAIKRWKNAAPQGCRSLPPLRPITPSPVRCHHQLLRTNPPKRCSPWK